MIFWELQKFVERNYGAPAWSKLLVEAKIGPKFYLTFQNYPDAEALALVASASTMTGVQVPALLESFGEFIAPDLITNYRHLIQPDWKTLDFLEHTEEAIHRVVRHQNPGASPPRLKATRKSPHEVVIEYRSQRKMCGVAKGIVKGAATHFKERVFLTEQSCMNRGDPECQITVRVT